MYALQKYIKTEENMNTQENRIKVFVNDSRENYSVSLNLRKLLL